MIITDAQVHLWGPNSPEDPWPDSPVKPQRETPLGAEEFIGIMDSCGVGRAVVVPPSWVGDRNEVALAAARTYPQRLAVMGRIDLSSTERPDLATWREMPGMLGLRLTFNWPTTVPWLTDGTAEWAFSQAAEVGLPVMIYVPGQTREIAGIAKRHPDLKLICDHLNLATQLRDDDAFREIEPLYALADFDNVAIKVSSLPSFVSDPFPFRSLHTHIERLVNAFGAQRCCWGSDYSRLTSPYEEWIRTVVDELSFLDPQQIELLMGGSLARILDWPIVEATDIPSYH